MLQPHNHGLNLAVLHVSSNSLLWSESPLNLLYQAPLSPLYLLFLDFLGLLFIGEMPPTVLLSNNPHLSYNFLLPTEKLTKLNSSSHISDILKSMLVLQSGQWEYVVIHGRQIEGYERAGGPRPEVTIERDGGSDITCRAQRRSLDLLFFLRLQSLRNRNGDRGRKLFFSIAPLYD